MRPETILRGITLILIAFCLAGCQNAGLTPTSIGGKTISVISTASPTSDSSLFLTRYIFPSSIDPAKRYMFYLHGKTIEDQGIPTFSREYGQYEYEAILEKLASHGLTVISEQRPKDTDGTVYAKRIVDQIQRLVTSNVPSENITVVGASKGAGIAATVSYFLKDTRTNFVLLGFCSPDTIDEMRRNQLWLYGNVLAIHDSVDGFAGSCADLYAFSEGKGLGRHDEIVLHIGTGHGILYKPLDEWILPTIQWAEQ